MMATFHRMKDEQGNDVVRCFVKGAPDQLLARAAERRRRRDGPDRRRRRRQGEATWPRTSASGSRACACMATGRKDFDPATFDPNADLLPLLDGLTLLALVGIVDPPEAGGQGRHRHGQGGGHPGAHDHRRPRRDGEGHRRPARHRGPRRHRRRVRGDERRRARSRRSTTSASSPGSPRRTRSASSTSSSARATSSP